MVHFHIYKIQNRMLTYCYKHMKILHYALHTPATVLGESCSVPQPHGPFKFKLFFCSVFILLLSTNLLVLTSVFVCFTFTATLISKK